MSYRSLSLTPLASALLIALSSADTIHTTEGSTIEDCTVLEETLLEVTYRRDGGNKTSMPSSDVLRIDFTTMPTLVDRAETAVADDQLFDAVSDLTVYLDGALNKIESGSRVRPAWAPAYAAWRLAELNASMGKIEETLAATNKLISKFTDSRYIPAALLLKAEVQFANGDGGAAKKTLEGVSQLVAEKGISERWDFDAKIAAVMYDDSLSGDKRRDALKRIANQAGSKFASVRNRAQAIGAETLLREKDFDGAKAVFERVAKDPKSDQRTLAIAWSGLGDCLFEEGAKNPTSEASKATLNDALKAYMRVVVLHKGESNYVARAMVYSGRIYMMMETVEATENANKLFGAVIRQFPGSKWAQEARGFARRS